MENYIPRNTNQKKARVVLSIADEVDFNANNVAWDKDGHFMTEVSIHQRTHQLLMFTNIITEVQNTRGKTYETSRRNEQTSFG